MARPASQSQVDFGAMLNRLSTGDKVIGVSLILLFIDSFIGTWFHYSLDNCGAIGSVVGCSGTYGTLWSGIGIIAALLLLVAMAFYVIRLFFATQVQLPALPLPDWQLWSAFGIVEIVLFILHWLVGRGSFSGVDISDVPGLSRTPGWGWYVGVILGIVIVVGGYLKQHDPEPAAIAGGGTVGGGYGGYGGTPPQPGYGPPQYGAPQPPASGYPEQPPAPGYPPPAPPPEQPPPPPPSGGYGAPPQP